MRDDRGAVMGKQDQYVVAKKYLAEINHILETERMTIDKREALQRQAARLSGVIPRPWLPVSWSRRFIMAAIVILGLQQAWTGNYEPMVFWLPLPLFSPRIVGWWAYPLKQHQGRRG